MIAWQNNSVISLTVSFAFGIGLHSVVRAESAVLYHARQLEGLWADRDATWPYDLNDLGVVTGYSFCECGGGGGSNEAVTWSETEGLTPLGDLPGGLFSSIGFSISNRGHVAGGSYSSASSNNAAFWSPATGMVSIGDLPGLNFNSVSFGINDQDQCVGYSSGSFNTEAFIWDPINGIKSLGQLAGGRGYSMANAINNRSEITGSSSSGQRFIEAFIWDPERGMRGLGTSQDGGFAYEGNAINDLGQITGRGASPKGVQAYLWDPVEGFSFIGHLSEGNAHERYTIGYGINDHGQVVGAAQLSMTDFRAFIWDSARGIRQLNTLVDAASASFVRRLTSGYAINNKGQIVAVGLYSYLLTPFTLADMNCDGTVNAFDIDGFILTLGALSGDAADATEYAEKYPGCHGDWAADANQDGSVNLFDIGAFVAMLGG